MIRCETPELNADQRRAIDEQHTARGASPLGMTLSEDATGSRTLVWSCDLWPLGQQEAINLRGALAAASFYADVADQRYAHGFCSDVHPGGKAAVDRLIGIIQQACARMLQ
jgi:hypothetical protein